jgi:hypothetical protein
MPHCLHALKKALFVREIQCFEWSARMRSGCEGSQSNRTTGILRALTDRSGGHAAGLSARGRAHARTGGATGAGRHGDVKQASPTLQQVINDLQALPVSQISRLLTVPFHKLEALSSD